MILCIFLIFLERTTAYFILYIYSTRVFVQIIRHTAVYKAILSYLAPSIYFQ